MGGGLVLPEIGAKDLIGAYSIPLQLLSLCRLLPDSFVDVTRRIGRGLSVFLETIKRGDLDVDGKNGPCTIMLRLYEAFGGYTSVGLQIDVGKVVAAYEMNLLEDDAGLEALALDRTSCEEGGQRLSDEAVSIWLGFRGFEVKTIKLVLAKEG